jgi:hypothetical protein
MVQYVLIFFTFGPDRSVRLSTIVVYQADSERQMTESSNCEKVVAKKLERSCRGRELEGTDVLLSHACQRDVGSYSAQIRLTEYRISGIVQSMFGFAVSLCRRMTMLRANKGIPSQTRRLPVAYDHE